MRLTFDLHRVERAPVSKPPQAIPVPGWPRPVWLRPSTEDSSVFRQLVLARELDLDFEPEPRRILDGGANIGLASLTFAHRWPRAEILAVELEQSNFKQLQLNLESFPRVRAINAALWSRDGRVSVASSPGDGECGYRVGAAVDQGGVQAVAIGTLLDDVGWDTVDVIKLDIEGAELEVLADAGRWLHRTRHLVVELHERFAPGCQAAFDRVIDRGHWTVNQHGEYLVASRRQ